MAEISLQHLMENDFVYVSGRLNSYTKVDSSGRDMLFYKVPTIVNLLAFPWRNCFFFHPFTDTYCHLRTLVYSLSLGYPARIVNSAKFKLTQS